MTLIHHSPDTECPATATDDREASLADKLLMRLLVRPRPPVDARASMSFPPRPTQLPLPLGKGEQGEDGTPLPSLFRAARRVGSVLSYEQASLDQIVPDTMHLPGTPRDRLMLPGGIGLVLRDGATGSLALDWMQWGETADTALPPARARCEATLGLSELRKAGRSERKRARRRCVVPLSRYSVPVRTGDMWAHRWVAPAGGQVACAAGIWIAERGATPCFSLVTESLDIGLGGETASPLLLTESDVLVWLRAPLKEALARIGTRA